MESSDKTNGYLVLLCRKCKWTSKFSLAISFFSKVCSTAGYKWDWEGNLSAEYWSLIVHGHCYKKYDITKTNFILMFNWKLLVIFLLANGRWKDNLCFESFLSCLCYFGGQTYLPLCGGSRQNIGVKTAAAPPPDLERGSFGEEPQNLWDKAFVFKSFCSVYVYYTIYFYILILLICKPCNGNCFLLKPLICPLFDT